MTSKSKREIGIAGSVMSSSLFKRKPNGKAQGKASEVRHTTKASSIWHGGKKTV